MTRIYEFLLVAVIGGFIFMVVNNTNNTIPIIPLKDFFRNPEKSSFQMSPDGKTIAYMRPWEEGNRMMNVYVKSMDEKNPGNSKNDENPGFQKT